MLNATYARTAAARTYARRFVVTFAYGMGLTAPMDLSVTGLETMRRDGDITADASCPDCGAHVTECPDVAHLLLDWPERTYSTTWGGELTAAELNA